MTNKNLSSAAYVVGILLFFLPFVEIKCNSTPLYEAKGIELVKGFTMNKKIADPYMNDPSYKSDTEDKKKQSGNMFAVAALALGILGLILSFLNFKSRPVVAMTTGLLAAVSLIALMIDIKNDVGKTASTGLDSDQASQMLSKIQVTAEFTAWFYLSLISFLAAAFFSYKSGLPMAKHETPPKNAPQLSIENPGEQSEFPSAPSESEIG